MATKTARKRRKPVTKLRKRKSLGGTQRLLSPTTVKKLELDWQIFELRRDGHSIHEIAQTLQIGDATVRSHLQEVLSRTIKETAETAEENRQLQIDRLDCMLVKYMRMAQGYRQEEEVRDPKDPRKTIRVMVDYPPNMAAAGLVLSIEARRSKLLALDMPEIKKLDVTGIREYVGVDVSQV